MNASELQIVIEVDTSAFEAAMDVIADMLNQALVAIQNLGEGFLEESQKMAQSGNSLVGNVGQVGTAFLATVGSASVLNGAFAGLGAMFKSFGEALSNNPIGLVITIIAALVAIIATCYEKFDTFRAVVNVTWAGIKDFAIIIADGVIAEFKISLDLLEWLGRLFMDLGMIVGTFVVAPFKLLIDALQGLYYATIGHDWGKAGEAFKQFGTDASDAANNIKDSAVDIVQDTKDMAQNVSKDFTDGVKGITKVLNGLPMDVTKAYQDAFKKKEIPESKVDINKLTITPKKITLDTKGAEVDSQPLTIPAMMQAPEMPKVDTQDDSQIKDIPALDAALKKETLAHQQAAEAAREHREAMQDLAGAGGKAVSTLAEGMGEIAAGKKVNMGAMMMKMLGDAIKSYGEKLIGLGATMLGFGDPMGGLKLAEGGALVAAGSAMNAIKMAAGGLVSGSSIVNVGEYAGASHNPEVIAPLDKLHSMLGGQTQNHTFEIQGDKLVSILQRVDNNTSYALGGA